MDYKNGDIINTIPTFLQRDLEQSKSKHFKSMAHFLKRRMKKLEIDTNGLEITVRPQIVIIYPNK